jgi:hypothetical protein
MKNYDGKALEQAQTFLFCHDKQQAWRKFSQLLSEQLARVKKEPVPFTAWWKDNFHIFSALQVQISAVNPGFSSAEDEYIEIRNDGPSIIDLSKWRLNAGSESQNYVFGKNTLLLPNDTIRIYVKDKHLFSFDSKRPLLNNQGDSVLLFDHLGHLVSSFMYGKTAHKEVGITHIFFDGLEPLKESDEFIDIANLGHHIVDLSHWAITSQGGQRFEFPEGTKLMPYSEVRVYTNKIDETTGGYSFNSKRAIWNNNGDIGKLYDYQDVLVSEYAYS